MDYTLNDSLLHLLHRAAQVAEDLFAGNPAFADLTARQFIVLAAVSSSEGASQIAIGAQVGIDRSTMGDIIGRLQSKGLVSRERAKQDVRAYSVKLTTAGQRVLAEALPVAKRVESQLSNAVSTHDRNDFVQCLRAIIDSAVPGRRDEAKGDR